MSVATNYSKIGLINDNYMQFNNMKTACASAGQSLAVLDSPLALSTVMVSLGSSNATS